MQWAIENSKPIIGSPVKENRRKSRRRKGHSTSNASTKDETLDLAQPGGDDLHDDGHDEKEVHEGEGDDVEMEAEMEGHGDLDEDALEELTNIVDGGHSKSAFKRGREDDSMQLEFETPKKKLKVGEGDEEDDLLRVALPQSGLA